MQSLYLEDDCYLPAFQSSHYLEGTPSLNRGLQIINNFIELNYMTCSVDGLELTNPGIEYMMRKHREFMDQVDGQTIDFGDFAAYMNNVYSSAKKPGHNMSHQFKKQNMLLPVTDDGVDYNKIRFKKKAPGEIIE
ncbi:hypothetical protein QKU48_gp1037 [Fadolivirus algeromassiliense]|jgi:hypothetical protein|uniref:Uncharacterized protein n=1 Tax=Fadolivirus FV1/VV64 TaxID=3070911 RepID=A0A7D3V5U6_9VIRU|nr:hypothetical protein QKU48_gp1037 [Fadolivirus algeromassiliense]QKF94495.1 hypothetical protein Fadolivirus_1_1037 [Fadolivirus FV1/VV64]